MVGAYSSATELSRNVLVIEKDAGHSLLEPFIQHAGAVADALNEFSRFLEEDSIPADGAQFNQHMIEEMNALWDIRRRLLDDLKLYGNEDIVTALSQRGAGSRDINDCIDELDSMRSGVNQTLGNEIRAAWDDLSSDWASSKQRVESRAAVIRSLNDLAEKWDAFSDKLSLVQEIYTNSLADLQKLALIEVDVAIVTVLPEELQAVLDVLGIELVPQAGQPFYQCQLLCRGSPGRLLDLVITSSPRPLNMHVGAPVARLRNKYSPRAAFLVGIAGGRAGKVSRGDVVIGQRVFYYEPGRVTSEGTAPRPQIVEPANAYGNGLYSYDPDQTHFGERIQEFIARLSESHRPSRLTENHVPVVRRATIASGENVMRDGKVLSTLANRFDDSIAAVDQESYGFADSMRDLPWAIFRGISDNVNEIQDDRWKYVAAGFAAVCLRDFLETFYVPPDVAEL
jgi:nucleoside phosphorylase